MVRVDHTTTDLATAWRVRDLLACHPQLGGATADINVIVNRHSVMLKGWTLDDDLVRIARQLAGRAAGRRLVDVRLQSGYACTTV